MTATASVGVAAAMSQSIIFIGYDLVAKHLRERGIDPLTLSYALRLALWPSLAVLVWAWDRKALTAFVADPTGMWALAGFLASALVFQWVYFKCLHVTHSLSVASVTRNAIGLPLLMILGFFVNGDQPTLWGVGAIGLMICASFLRPGRNHMDGSQFIESAKTVLGLSLAFVTLVTIKDPLYRLFLQHSQSLVLGVAIYMVIFSAALYVYFWVFPVADDTTSDGGDYQLLMLAVPVFWVIGTIPEGIAFGLLPVYSMIAIGTVSWIVTMGSDIYFKRLALSRRTAGFAVLVLGSITLSIIDRHAA